MTENYKLTAEEEKMAKTIRQELKKGLKRYVGKANTKNTRKAVKNYLTKLFEQLNLPGPEIKVVVKEDRTIDIMIGYNLGEDKC